MLFRGTRVRNKTWVLVGAFDNGQVRYKQFVDDTLSTDDSKSLFAAIKKSKLQTFSALTKNVKLMCNGKIVKANMNPEIVFRRALTISQTRGGMNMDVLMSKPITSVPLSLFHEDGSFRKTNKAVLLSKLEQKVESRSVLAQDYNISSATYVRDAMAIIQQMKGDQFGKSLSRETSVMF